MLEIILVCLFALWVLGFFFVHLGSIIHVLLMLIVFGLIFRAIRRNRTTTTGN